MRYIINIIFVAMLLCFTSAAAAEDIDIEWTYEKNSFDLVDDFRLYSRLPDGEYDFTMQNSSVVPATCDEDTDSEDYMLCVATISVNERMMFVLRAYGRGVESESSNEVEYIPFVLPAPNRVRIRINADVNGTGELSLSYR